MIREDGPKREFSTGAKKQNADNKGTPVLIPPDAIFDLAVHFAKGAKLHGDRNWEKGIPLSELLNSLERHLLQEKLGSTDERHDRALVWNAVVYLATKLRIQKGWLPKILDDMPRYGSHPRVSAYLSHYIRGMKGKDATHQDIVDNCRIVIAFANRLTKKFPDLDLYVPAVHDEFVNIAYEEGTLSEKDILATDCTILSQRDLLLVYAPNKGLLSRGMDVECKFAKKIKKPIIMFQRLDRKTQAKITLAIEKVQGGK